MRDIIHRFGDGTSVRHEDFGPFGCLCIHCVGTNGEDPIPERCEHRRQVVFRGTVFGRDGDRHLASMPLTKKIIDDLTRQHEWRRRPIVAREPHELYGLKYPVVHMIGVPPWPTREVLEQIGAHVLNVTY